MDCTLAAAYAALSRSGVHDLRVVTRSYSLSQLSLLKKHDTLNPDSLRSERSRKRPAPKVEEPGNRSLRYRANADSDRLCRPVVVANAWRSIIGRDEIG